MAEIRKSLYKPQLFCGIQRMYAVMMAIMFIIIMLFGDNNERIVGGVAIGVLWILMAAANAFDYLWFTVLIKYLSQKHYYKAYSKSINVANLRVKQNKILAPLYKKKFKV